MTGTGDDIRAAGPAGPPALPVPGPVAPAPWPYGPGRPGEATAAAVLALGVALLIGMGGLAWFTTPTVVDPTAVVLAPILPCALGLAVGAVLLLRRRGRRLLLASVIGVVAVLVATTLVNAGLHGEGWMETVGDLFIWLPIPIVTAWFAALPRVGNWVADRPVPAGEPLPYAPPPQGRPPELWPYGPARPRAAMAAAVLGQATAGGTFLIAPFALALSVTEDGIDGFGVVALLMLACGAGMLAGSLALLHRRSRTLLLVSALAAGTVLVLAHVLALVARPAEWLGRLLDLALLLPLPVLTAASAAHGSVREWLADPAG